MAVVITLAILTLIVPLFILRRLSFVQKMLIVAIILAHIGIMLFLHFRLVGRSGYPIVVDLHSDAQKYYDATSAFDGYRAFGVVKEDAVNAAEGSRHWGYYYAIGTMWTISSHPALAIRMFKTFMFFMSLACLTRVWRREYGMSLATGGFAFLSIFCTPTFYYNYRNLKDGLILSLFIFLMAILDTVLPPWKNRVTVMKKRTSVLAWVTVLILLYALSTLRLYIVTLIGFAVIMHAVVASRLGLRQRVLLMCVLSIFVMIAFTLPFVANTMEMYQGSIRSIILTPVAVLQGFLSPIPWGRITVEEPGNVLFYSIYWLLLPYAIYTLLRHIRNNLNWHLFLYMAITYVVGVVIGDAPRKRLIVYPILVGWVLAHLAYKRWVRAGRPELTPETNDKPIYNLEYLEDDLLPAY